MFEEQRLDIETIAAQLTTCSIGHTIKYYTSVPSTMPLAQRVAVDPAGRSGTVVVGEEQTAGRGRLDRQWHAPPGLGLLSTIVIKRPHLPANPSLLAMAAGIAGVRALTDTEPALKGQVVLKWPNDILVVESDEPKAPVIGKLAGILIETSYQGSTLAHALIGIGINVNQNAGQLPTVPVGSPTPTSIYLCRGHRTDRNRLLVALCRHLDRLLAGGPTDHSSDLDQHQTVYDEWRSLLHTLGQSVIVHPVAEGDTFFQGVAVDVDHDGALIVAGSDGSEARFNAGDVTLRNAGE